MTGVIKADSLNDFIKRWKELEKIGQVERCNAKNSVRRVCTIQAFKELHNRVTDHVIFVAGGQPFVGYDGTMTSLGIKNIIADLKKLKDAGICQNTKEDVDSNECLMGGDILHKESGRATYKYQLSFNGNPIFANDSDDEVKQAYIALQEAGVCPLPEFH